MGDIVEIPSFAKINLGLIITGKRKDGYHDIESILQTISLKDRIYFNFGTRGISVECASERVPDGHENIVYKAVESFMNRTGIRVNTKITIEKNIPVGGGLGGGSSNAAATILVLDQYYRTNLECNNLMEIASDIGSDVPFFIRGGTAYVKGRGNRVEWKDDIPEMKFLLVTFPFTIPTAKAYSMWDDRPIETLTNQNMTVILKLLIDGEKEVIENLRNSFTESVVKEYPEINIAIKMLAKFKPAKILMSGSGPTVFSVFGSASDFVRARERMRELGYTSIICEAISRQDYCKSLKLKED